MAPKIYFRIITPRSKHSAYPSALSNPKQSFPPPSLKMSSSPNFDEITLAVDVTVTVHYSINKNYIDVDDENDADLIWKSLCEQSDFGYLAVKDNNLDVTEAIQNSLHQIDLIDYDNEIHTVIENLVKDEHRKLKKD